MGESVPRGAAFVAVIARAEEGLGWLKKLTAYRGGTPVAKKSSRKVYYSRLDRTFERGLRHGKREAASGAGISLPRGTSPDISPPGISAPSSPVCPESRRSGRC